MLLICAQNPLFYVTFYGLMYNITDNMEGVLYSFISGNIFNSILGAPRLERTLLTDKVYTK